MITPKKWDQEISREVAQDGKKNVHELSEEERPLNDQEDTVFEADSDLNDKHYPADLESRISDPEDAPKKSYASIVSSETRKGTVKVYVPAGTSKATPVKTEKEADLAAKLSAQAAELLPPSATSSIASEGKVSEDEGKVIQHICLKISLLTSCILACFFFTIIKKCRSVIPLVFYLFIFLCLQQRATLFI